VFYFPEYGLITFPVKHNWWEAADLDLIDRSARELLRIIEVKKIRDGTTQSDFYLSLLRKHKQETADLRGLQHK